MPAKNNLMSKIKRTITSVLPIDKKRQGHCANCGKCCCLPQRCPFLKEAGDKSYCSIYKVRPLNCRKYPRTADEFVSNDQCGFKFND